MGKPECLLLVANRGVAVRVERLKHHCFAVLRIDAYDLIDGEDFSSVRTAHVRHDRVLILPLIQQNRLSGLIEKIDDRRAPEPKRLIRDPQPQHLLALILVIGADQKDEFRPILEAGRPDFLESHQVEEEELLRKGEVLLQQPVADKRAPRIRQHSLVLTESDGLQRAWWEE